MSEKNTCLTIENEHLRAEITKRGAELRALYEKPHGFDCLKRQDDPYWDGVAPILFPICGRLWEQTAYINGTPYRMGTHGFASDAEFTVAEHTETRVILSLCDSESLLQASYPFPFTLTVEYRLDDSALTTRVVVRNRGTTVMPFAVGFHPGFSLPVAGAGEFEDCYLDFSSTCSPEIWRLSDSGYLLDGTDPYPLKNGRILPLKHGMFDSIDSIFFVGAGDSVTLASPKTDRKLRIDFAGFPYLGLWKPNDPSASFLCIEPWYGSPDREGICTELSEKRDMLLLPAGEEKSFEYRITAE